MTRAEERAYAAGGKAVHAQNLAAALAGLGVSGSRGKAAALAKERAEAVVALRSICAEHGDNDWEDNLNLADVIEKHLGRHL